MKIAKVLFICILSYNFSTLYASDTFQIKSKWANKCLDVKFEDKGKNGNRVQLWDCHSGVNQQWLFIKFANGYSAIKTRWTYRVLDVAREGQGLNGNKIHLWRGVPESNNQEWKLIKLDNGAYIIKSRWKHKCLDAMREDQGSNGNRIIFWECHYGNNQQWILTAKGSDSF